MDTSAPYCPSLELSNDSQPFVAMSLFNSFLLIKLQNSELHSQKFQRLRSSGYTTRNMTKIKEYLYHTYYNKFRKNNEFILRYTNKETRFLSVLKKCINIYSIVCIKVVCSKRIYINIIHMNIFSYIPSVHSHQ
jgi:hypothetical protein